MRARGLLSLAAASALVVGLAPAGRAAAPQVVAAVPTSGLVLSYTFANETGTVVRDRSTSGINGTLVNASAPTAYVTSLPGHDKALRLVGSKRQYVDVGDAARLDVNRYTLAAWVRYTGVQDAQTLDRWEVMEKAGAYWMNIRTTGQVRVGGFYGGCANPSWKYLDSPKPIPAQTWTHVAATYNGSRLTIWVNGAKVASRAISGTTCANGEPLAVGAKNAPAKGLLEAFYDGDLDDVRIYSRALGASGIASLAAR
ncbi:MAG TPA: LamG domain-containing protein [Actinomycetales bacterium]|nr:LamG domain-containing protein [Actinomycetales bacterium]